MNSNKKNFNRYIFLSTFARNLIEVFIGTILFKKGFSLHSIIYYYLLVNVFSVILSFPCAIISKKYSNKALTILAIISFSILQIILIYIKTEMYLIYIIAFLFALYRRCYWIARRYYTLQVIKEKSVSKEYSIISIVNQIGVIISSYIGSLLLEFINIKIVTVISIGLLAISYYFISKLNFKYENNNIKLDLIETFKNTPVSSIIHIGCFELQNVVKFFLPLYLIIYVKDNYTMIGFLNLIANIATIIFTYVYGRIINKEKNYLKMSILFVLLIRILQINTFGAVLIIVSFLEGFSFKMYEQSYNKEYILLSKNFEYHNYNFMYEIIQNVIRLVVVFIIFIFIKDVKDMIYFVLFIISVCILFKFKTKPLNNDSKIIWKKD